MSSSIIAMSHPALVKRTLGYWTPTAGQEVSLSVIDGYDISKCELLIFTPFSGNAYRPSLINDPSHFTTGLYSTVGWVRMNNNVLTWYYLDCRRHDNYSIYCKASDNIPSDTRLELFGLISEENL